MLDGGTIVAGYRVDGVLGEGGMAIVYRATQLSLNRTVALKLLASELSNDPGFRERFRREGQLQAALDHLHIVPVYEAGETEAGLFLAMRLILGSTLKELILGGGLDPRRSLRLLAQAATALDAAHEAGLIHRDVKPQNILIGTGDHVYLADFGLIKAPDEVRLTGTGQFMGTIDYVAPEQIQAEPATAASDCYALAAVLYECLTSEVPFPRPSEAATLHAHVTAPPPRLSERAPELPAALDEVIAGGMAKDPAQRPASASELIRAARRAVSTAAPRSGQDTRRAEPLVDLAGGSQATRGYRTSPSPVAPTVPAGADPTVAAAEPVAGGPAAAATAGVAERAAASPDTERPRAAGAVPARVLPVLAVIALVVIVGGFLVGHSGGGTASAGYANSATVGHLQLRYPSGWQLGTTPLRIPGITFSNPLALSPGAGKTGLTAGEVRDGGGSTLLPASFAAKVRGGLPRSEQVALGSLHAYRYTGVVVRGVADPLTVYVVPTSAGVATVACSVSAGFPQGFQTRCGRVAATLALVGASAYALGPSAGYAKLLSSAFDQLRAALAKPTAALRAAGTPSAQASAATQLAQAYTHASAQLNRAGIDPQVREANTAVVAALNGLAGDYSRAATAAKAGSSASYGSAEAKISRDSTALSAAIRALSVLGYKTAA